MKTTTMIVMYKTELMSCLFCCSIYYLW